MNRRLFIGGLASSALAPMASGLAHAELAGKSKKILVLGGTNFLGPAIVEELLKAGHEVTLLNRGITRPYLFPGVEKLRGNRREGVSGLAELGATRKWDAAIDVWAANEEMVAASTELLADRVGYYYFVSSIAVYQSFAKPELEESSALRLTSPGYGGEKARSEARIADVFADRFGIARCPSIFGPRDPGSSLHFWLRNLHTNDEILAPGSGDDPVQFVDVRDIGRWIVRSVEANTVGVFNAAALPQTFREFLILCQRVTQSKTKLTWLPRQFLYERSVEAFSQIPLWVPVEEDPGFFQISSAKARNQGFETRPAVETLAASWRWYQSAFFDGTVFPHNGLGISAERQSTLLADWHSAN